SSIKLTIPVVRVATTSPVETRIDASVQPVPVGGKFTLPYTTNSDPALAPVKYTIVGGQQSTISLHSVDANGVPTFIAHAVGNATVMLTQDATATNSPGAKAVAISVQGTQPITGWKDPIEVDFDH